MPQISVIVPVYQVEKYIHRCVDSILGQTYTDFELILVDDGSPDNCGIICDEYAAKDSRVHVIHQENGGLSAARNAGIDWVFANSDSQWLSFIDSDDWAHPEYLQRLLNAAIDHNVSVSICGYAHTDGQEPEIVPDTLIPVLWDTEDFYVQHNVNATVAWGKLYRKECFRKIRYPVGKIHEDEFTTHTVLFPAEHVAVIKASLYYYFFNLQGITKGNWSPKRFDGLKAMRCQKRYMKEHSFEKAYHHAKRKYMASLSAYIYCLKAERLRFRMRYIPGLRWKLKWMIIIHHTEIPLNQFPGIYESAFPCFMYFYWIVRAQINKLLKKIG